MSSISTPEDSLHDKRRHIVRWLLRPLAEPAFLRFYVEKEFETTLPLALFESTFWGLEPNSEHLATTQKDAWKKLKDWLPPTVPKATEWFRILLQELSSSETDLDGMRILEDVKDLSTHWSLPELFAKPSPPKHPPQPYYELHCHLRGAVPFMHLWNRFLDNEPVRANLRKHKCEAGGWSKTWAELCALAAACAPVTEGDNPLLLWEMAQRVRKAPEPCDHEIRYLAICAGLRRHLLHQRGEVGLSSFVISYDRYSKLQKGRGLGERIAARDAVCAILEKFRAHGCVAIELRPTLENNAEALHRKLQDVILGYFHHVRDSTARGLEPLAMGLVPSLFKQDLMGKDAYDGEVHPQIWEAQAQLWSDQVEILLDVLDQSPVFRHFIVGIDAAGKELGCPPRVLARAFAQVRERTARHGLARVRAGRPISLEWMKRLVREARDESLQDAWDALNGAYVPHTRLGLTIHAGEDFADPLTGLRHIWESVHALDLWEGDRMGHAIAAALDEKALETLLARRAEEKRGAVVEKLKRDGQTYFRIRKPRGTHLLDLAWMYRRAEGDGERNWAGTMLMQALGESSRHVLDVERVVRLLEAESETVWPFFPGVRYQDPSHVHPEHWTWVCLDREGMRIFERLRQRVLSMLIRRGIVIESCPTSNLAVANLQEPPLRTLLKSPSLRCVIATDDPGLLDAWPNDEFVRAKTTPTEKERLLKESKRSSFVRIA